MQITLNQEEIKKAIITYVSNQDISITGKHVDITLIAGRAPNGMSASINISNDDKPSTVPTPRKFNAEASTTVVEVIESDEAEEASTDEEVAQKPLFGAR